MRCLGIAPRRPRIGVFDFTGCEGCELQLANREETLAAFLGAVEVVSFREVSSERRDDYEIAFVDGCITRDDEVARLQAIRARAQVLVALGSCACFGGVARLKDAFDPAQANAAVYGARPKETGPARASRTPSTRRRPTPPSTALGPRRPDRRAPWPTSCRWTWRSRGARSRSWRSSARGPRRTRKPTIACRDTALRKQRLRGDHSEGGGADAGPVPGRVDRTEAPR